MSSTVTWNVNKDARICNLGGIYEGAGSSDANAVGLYGSATYRTLLGFSYSFSGMVSITSATLYMRASYEHYVAFGSSPSINVARLTQTWSEGGGTSLSTSNACVWPGPAATATNSAVAGMTRTEGAWDSIVITNLVRDAFAAGTFYGVRVSGNLETTAAACWEMYSREYSTSYDPYIVVVYETNQAPTAPTALSPTADTCIQNLTPTFTATFNDPDAGEVMGHYQINVYEDDGTTLKWDSGAITGSSINYTYNGPALTGNTFYKWTVRAQDDGGLWGPYQPTKSRFKVNSVPNAPYLALAQSPTNDITTLTPTFIVTHNDPDASDSLMSGYRLYVWNSDWSARWDTGYVAVSPAATVSVPYAGTALSWNGMYYWSSYTYDSNGATFGNWGSFPWFATHKTGIATGLTPTGGVVVSLDGGGNPMPTFTGSRATASDLLTTANIKVFVATDLVNPVWAPGASGTGVSSTGFSRAYGGATLSYGTSYAWQVQVNSSIGALSDWSSLQYFTTPAAGSISMTAPVSPVTVTTPTFTFGRTTNFNAWNLIVYSMAGAVLWDSGTQTMTAAATKSVTYATGGTINLATLAFATSYQWKVRVSADSGSTWGSGFTGLVQFNMDAAGVPVLAAPGSSVWIGAPLTADSFDTITGITNGANLSAAAEGTTYVTGRGSVKYTGTFSGVQMAYRTLATALDLSSYGNQTPIKIRAYISSLTSVTYLRVRFASTGGPATNYAEYTITPAGVGAWEWKTANIKGSPAATAGTINWADIKYIGIVASYAASVGPTIYIDDLTLDAIAPSFDGNTVNSEVISTVRVRVYSDGGGNNLVWDSGNISGTTTFFSLAYGGSALTAGNTYYWQASYVKASGAPGGYSALSPFTLNSAPTIPSSLDPQGGTILADSLTPTFTSTFNDNEKASRADYPTTYEVEVIRNSDSVLVYSLYKDSGLTGGTNSVKDGDSGVLKRTGAANPIAYETEYAYHVRYRDSMGAVGAWSSYTIFKPSQSPTATVSTPVNSSTLTSPALTISWAQSSPGSKGQNSYRIYVWNNDNSTVVYDSGRVYTSVASYAYPAGSLVNLTNYQFRVMTWDTDGLPSDWDNHAVYTNWAGPDPIVNFLANGDELFSAVKLEWQQSNLATNVFRKYMIYRKRSIDSNWSVLAEIPSITIVSYNDYLTAYGVSYDYKITQWSIVTGDADLQSGNSDIGTDSLENDTWYVVGRDRNPSHIFELIVTAAPFTEPVQQEIFEPLGTTRKVIVRGKVMGAEGNLTCKWPAEMRDTIVAQIDYIKSYAGPHILKSPFGDIWQVEFSGPSKEYEMGGHINIALTWTEVA